MVLVCPSCNSKFSSRKGLSLHIYHNDFCTDAFSTSNHHSRSNHVPSPHHVSIHTNFPFALDVPTETVKEVRTLPSENYESDGDECSIDSNCSEPIGIYNESNDLPTVSNAAFTNDTRVELQLLKIMNSIGAPHYAFKLVLEWARDAYQTGYQFHPKTTSYSGQINRFEKWTNFQNLRPTIKKIVLPPDEIEMEVTVFNFSSMLASLFNDTNLNQSENLVVNQPPFTSIHNPFTKFIPKDGRLSEVNSGKWYNIAYSNMINDSSTDFLAPIIFSMDKTSLSTNAHISVYAIMFTTTIFNLKVCIFLGSI